MIAGYKRIYSVIVRKRESVWYEERSDRQVRSLANKKNPSTSIKVQEKPKGFVTIALFDAHVINPDYVQRLLKREK